MIRNNRDVASLLRGLEAHGYKLTEQRVAVCDALVAHGGHPTAAEVYALLHESFPSISLATVYNTLAALEEHGLIQPMPLATDEHKRYDLDLEPHVNIVCQHCSNIVDAYSPSLVPMLRSVAEDAGATFETANIVVYGRCAACC
jgi:Fur family peroxide stress response transcriptional regulator